MIQLTSKELSKAALDELNRRQDVINAKGGFTQQSSYTQTAWSGKKGSAAGKATFVEIKEMLLGMCIGVEICNYCENNEATDVEHIFPKTWFPGRTFRWENYLLACGKCNTHVKKGQFVIFNPQDSTNRLIVNAEPATEDACIVNPRIENPMDFLYLNIKLGIFVVHPKHNKGTREYLKADYTRTELLHLNKRDGLVNARRKAAAYYQDRLNRYVQVLNSTNFDELDLAIDPIEILDKNLDFQEEKEKYLGAICHDIMSYAHPTVWKEMIRQRQNYQKLNALFEQAPEALQW